MCVFLCAPSRVAVLNSAAEYFQKSGRQPNSVPGAAVLEIIALLHHGSYIVELLVHLGMFGCPAALQIGRSSTVAP